MSFSLTLRGKLAIYGAALRTGWGAETYGRAQRSYSDRRSRGRRHWDKMAAAARGSCARRGAAASPRGRALIVLPACLLPSLPPSLPPSGPPRCVRRSPAAASSALSTARWVFAASRPLCPPARLLDPEPPWLSLPCGSQHTFLDVVTAPKAPWMCSHFIWAKKSAWHWFSKAVRFPAVATRSVPALPKNTTTWLQ